MVGYAGSPTYTVYVDVNLTQSKVKVTWLLNFRQLAKPCMPAAMTAAPLTRHIMLSDSAVILTQYRRVTDRQTDRRTELL